MSNRNTTTDKRRRAQRADASRQHTDKYAEKRTDPDEQRMADKLAELAAHFNTGRGDR